MKKYIEKGLPIFIILAAALFRLIPHAPNFTPIGAMALFGGAYLSKRSAFIIPLAAMFISDIFLGFHSTMVWVYSSFILTGLIGLYLKNKICVTNVFLATLSSSFLFYLITNFGVWFSTSMYPKTIEGLVQCYVMAIPFFRNTVMGDLFYNILFFGSFVFLQATLFNKNILKSN